MKEKLINPVTSPRYDDIFYEGLEWLNSLATGEETSMKPKTEYFDNSKLNSFMACPRRYFYEWELGLEPADKNLNLHFGACIHDGLADFYKDMKTTRGLTIPSIKKAYKTFSRNFCKEETNYDSNGKNLESGIKLLEVFFSTPEYYNFGKVLAVEEPIYSPILRLAGKPDLICEKSKDELLIVDHKTTSKLSSSSFSKWRQNRGLIGYSALARTKYPKYKTYTTIVNILHAVTKPDVQRATYRFSDFQLSEWLQSSSYYIKKIEEARARNFWPKTGSNCQVYGCAYQDLCDQNRRHDQVVIPATYQKREEWYC